MVRSVSRVAVHSSRFPPLNENAYPDNMQAAHSLRNEENMLRPLKSMRLTLKPDRNVDPPRTYFKWSGPVPDYRPRQAIRRKITSSSSQLNLGCSSGYASPAPYTTDTLVGSDSIDLPAMLKDAAVGAVCREVFQSTIYKFYLLWARRQRNQSTRNPHYLTEELWKAKAHAKAKAEAMPKTKLEAKAIAKEELKEEGENRIDKEKSKKKMRQKRMTKFNAKMKERGNTKIGKETKTEPNVAVKLFDGRVSRPLKISKWFISDRGQLLLSCSLNTEPDPSGDQIRLEPSEAPEFKNLHADENSGTVVANEPASPGEQTPFDGTSLSRHVLHTQSTCSSKLTSSDTQVDISDDPLTLTSILTQTLTSAPTTLTPTITHNPTPTPISMLASFPTSTLLATTTAETTLMKSTTAPTTLNTMPTMIPESLSTLTSMMPSMGTPNVIPTRMSTCTTTRTPIMSSMETSSELSALMCAMTSTVSTMTSPTIETLMMPDTTTTSPATTLTTLGMIPTTTPISTMKQAESPIMTPQMKPPDLSYMTSTIMQTVSPSIIQMMKSARPSCISPNVMSSMMPTAEPKMTPPSESKITMPSPAMTMQMPRMPTIITPIQTSKAMTKEMTLATTMVPSSKHMSTPSNTLFGFSLESTSTPSSTATPMQTLMTEQISRSDDILCMQETRPPGKDFKFHRVQETQLKISPLTQSQQILRRLSVSLQNNHHSRVGDAHQENQPRGLTIQYIQHPRVGLVQLSQQSPSTEKQFDSVPPTADMRESADSSTEIHNIQERPSVGMRHTQHPGDTVTELLSAPRSDPWFTMGTLYANTQCVAHHPNTCSQSVQKPSLFNTQETSQSFSESKPIPSESNRQQDHVDFPIKTHQITRLPENNSENNRQSEGNVQWILQQSHNGSWIVLKTPKVCEQHTRKYSEEEIQNYQQPIGSEKQVTDDPTGVFMNTEQRTEDIDPENVQQNSDSQGIPHIPGSSSLFSRPLSKSDSQLSSEHAQNLFTFDLQMCKQPISIGSNPFLPFSANVHQTSSEILRAHCPSPYSPKIARKTSGSNRRRIKNISHAPNSRFPRIQPIDGALNVHGVLSSHRPPINDCPSIRWASQNGTQNSPRARLQLQIAQWLQNRMFSAMSEQALENSSRLLKQVPTRWIDMGDEQVAAAPGVLTNVPVEDASPTTETPSLLLMCHPTNDSSLKSEAPYSPGKSCFIHNSCPKELTTAATPRWKRASRHWRQKQADDKKRS